MPFLRSRSFFPNPRGPRKTHHAQEPSTPIQTRSM